MDNVRPSQWVVLVSGALLFVFSFFAVFEDSDTNAWNDFGLLTWPALLGMLAAVVTAAVVFGNVSLPERILTFTVGQILVIAAFTSALIAVGFLVMCLISDMVGPAVGTWLSAPASIGLLAGTVMEQEGSTSTSTRRSAAPPSPF